jgi:hypothetical protein
LAIGGCLVASQDVESPENLDSQDIDPGMLNSLGVSEY